MEFKEITDHSFFTDLNFAEFVKDAILETKYSDVGIRFKPAIISKEFIEAIENDSKVVFACIDHGKIAGILLGSIGNVIFSDTPIAEQLYVRVSESHRGNGIYKNLLIMFISWAKRKSCQMVLVGSHYHTSSAMLADIIKEHRLKPFHSSCFISI